MAAYESTTVNGVLSIRRAGSLPTRRLLYFNSYGMAKAWRLWEQGLYPGNHLWGCIELLDWGYEVIMVEPPRRHNLRDRVGYDWPAANLAVERLGPDDIVYCSHNVLLWTPILKAAKRVRAKLVGQIYAREPLPLSSHYSGVVAHTPVALDHLHRLCPPSCLCQHISWGVDLPFFTVQPYNPQYFLVTGKSFRDFEVLRRAFSNLPARLVIVGNGAGKSTAVSTNTSLVSDREMGASVYRQLVDTYYAQSGAVLVTLLPDERQRRAVGVTNVLEAMALARPVIVTRTGGLMSEIDVENEGVGIYVEPRDPFGLRDAVLRLYRAPELAEDMGRRGRQLCEQHFNMNRFGKELHAFLEAL